jgi:predicted metal-dependent enzyme (double-stranded beta helix superfamily)
MQMEQALYKPFTLVVTLTSGMLAGAVFQKVWKLAAHEDDAPDATDEDRAWAEILIASALQGALLGLTRAVLNRGGAKGVRKLTGAWPG